MTNLYPENRDPDLDEARMASRLRELDERRMRGENADGGNELDDLTPGEIEELRGAAECLKLLDLFRPTELQETARQLDTAAEFAEASPDVSPAEPDPELDQRRDNIAKDPPQYIGRYEVVRRLGTGGFGIVFQARDSQLERDVALKVLKPESIVSDSARQRFLREARAAAMLSHPSIVPIFEADHTGVVGYIAYELCHGQTLEQWLTENPPPLDQRLACQVVKHLSDGVQHAHSRGVIHRDLKPCNVILKSASDHGAAASLDVTQLRVTDFGLAQLESGDGDSLTQTGAPLGTPAYMSPEQAQGTTRLSASSDIYSLGVILYQLITGRVPFKHDSNFQTLQSIINEQPMSPRRQNSLIDRDVEAICLKCLEKQPQRRYGSCQALCDDLGRFLAGQTVEARTATATEKVRRWCGRNPVLASSLTALVLALVAGTTVSTVFWLNASAARQQSAIHEADASKQAAEALRQVKRTRLAVNQLLTAIANEPLIRSEGLEVFRQSLLSSATRFYSELWSERPTDPGLQQDFIETLQLLAELHAQLDDHQQAIEIANEAIALMNEHNLNDFPIRRDLRGRIANSMLVLGRLEDSNQWQQDTVSWILGLSEAHGETAEWQSALAFELSRQAQHALYYKDFARARTLNDQAIDLVGRIEGPLLLEWSTNDTNLQVLSTQTDLLIQTDSYVEGRELAEYALDMFGQLHPDNEGRDSETNYALAQLHFNIGITGSYSGDFSLAEEHYDLAIGLMDDLRRRHPDVGLYSDQWVSIRYSRALIHLFRNQLDAASLLLPENILVIDQSIDRFPDRYRVFGIHKANCLNLLYSVQRRNGHAGEARDTLMDAIFTTDRLIGRFPDDSYIKSLQGNFYGNLGFLENHESRINEALVAYARSIAILEPIARAQRQGESIHWLATAYAGAASASEKLEQFQSGLTHCEAFFEHIPSDHSLNPVVEQLQTLLLVGAGKVEIAMVSLADAASHVEDSAASFNWAKTASRCASLLESVEPELPEGEKDWPLAFLDVAVELLEQAADDPQLDRSAIKEQLLSEQAFECLRLDDRFDELIELFD